MEISTCFPFRQLGNSGVWGLHRGDDILLKTMYCLREEYRKPFEEWLVQNDFTDFGILKQADGTSPEIRSATAEIHIFRT